MAGWEQAGGAGHPLDSSLPFTVPKQAAYTFGLRDSAHLFQAELAVP